ncbi:cysteine desulfurase family protein [Thiohalorhabdus methylotrophus]|uniref:Cysteine desulfurase family protein n=1 Tax=Thiohalorhabdus methylotrophus TaxID=3242694 RepID=A0ABV4TQB1_9GAMM
MSQAEFEEIYLDNNASTPPLPEVREAMLTAMGAEFGNPSSAHSLGGRGKRLLNNAREQVATLAGARPENLYFSGSGTEANNWAILSAVAQHPDRKRLVTTPIEHSSVLAMVRHLEQAKGMEVCYVPVRPDGQVDLEGLKGLVTPDTAVVSVQWVNNETGVFQPVEEIAQFCREQGVPFHTDGAQAIGKGPMAWDQVAPDYLTFTAHKLHGPQGVGTLVAHPGAEVLNLFYGGGQESGRRPGTENLPGIVGFGQAAAMRGQRLADICEKMSRLRDRFEKGVLQEVPEVEVNGAPEQRVPNTSNLLFRGVEGQALMARLDQSGILCSQSSACTNSRPEPSYVLRAMGLPEEEAYASVRFSFSELNTADEVDRAVDQVAEIVERLRAFLRFGA